MEKICNRCDKSLPIELFSVYGKDKLYRRTKCHECYKQYMKEIHKEKNNETKREYCRKNTKAQLKKQLLNVITHGVELDSEVIELMRTIVEEGQGSSPP